MDPQSTDKSMYDCVYTLNNAKKHKTYTDGKLHCIGNKVSLYSHSDALVDKCIHKKSPFFEEDDDVTIGRYLVTVGEKCRTNFDEPAVKSQIPQGTLLPPHHQAPTVSTPSYTSSYTPLHNAKPPQQIVQPVKQSDQTKKSFTPLNPSSNSKQSSYSSVPKGSSKAPIAPTPSYLPVKKPQPLPQQQQPQQHIPAYSPDSKVLTLLETPHIYVSAQLNSYLRPHQRDGVKFAFNCIVGKANKDQHGVIIMDDVGLGKTIQSLAVIDSMLSYPYVKSKKVIICCPSILTNMWHRECGRWLPPFSFLYTVISPDKSDKTHVESFVCSQRPHILIISYEQVRKYSDILQRCVNPLLICDEAHRLKSNAETKTTAALQAIPTKLKLLLTATPIQNDLQEFYAMANFCVPSYLAPTLQEFVSKYVKPIAAMQNSFSAFSDSFAVEKGKQANAELFHRIAQFCLRRTHDTIAKYLPPKTTFLVFLHPTPLQIKLITILIDLHRSQPTVYQILPMLNLLRKCATSPYLLQQSQTTIPNAPKNKDDDDDDDSSGASQTASQRAIAQLTPHLPRCSLPQMIASSTKMTLLHKLIELYIPHTNIIVISSFTETLKYVQSTLPNYSCLSLDGSTDNKTRIQTIETFNNKQSNLTTNKHHILFLSAKAAGAGLNLINGCVQISLDSNWNPAIDTQAQGRMWRTGQTQHVMSFQLITNGSIDEHILLRQIAKNDIASSLLQKNGGGNDKNSKAGATGLNRFTPEELRRVLNFQHSEQTTYKMLSLDVLSNDIDINDENNLLCKSKKRSSMKSNNRDDSDDDNNDDDDDDDSEEEIEIKLNKNKPSKANTKQPKTVKRSKFALYDTSDDDNNDDEDGDDENDEDGNYDSDFVCDNTDEDGEVDGQQTENRNTNIPSRHISPKFKSTSDGEGNESDDCDWFSAANKSKNPHPPPPSPPSFDPSNLNNSTQSGDNNGDGVELEKVRGDYVYYTGNNLADLVELSLPVLTTSPATLHQISLQQKHQQQQSKQDSAVTVGVDENSPIFQRFVALGTSIFAPPPVVNPLVPQVRAIIAYCLVKQTNFEDEDSNTDPSSTATTPTNQSTSTTTSNDQNNSSKQIDTNSANSAPPPPINTQGLLDNFSGPAATSALLKRTIFDSSDEED